jgi:hypothetical protein
MWVGNDVPKHVPQMLDPTLFRDALGCGWDALRLLTDSESNKLG